jgi:putative Mn2+ efflux pump MntP
MLFILGIVAIVVFTIQVYKTASGNGRNAPVWAGITAVIGVGGQFILPFIVGIALGIYLAATGGDFENLEGRYFGLWTIVGIAGIVFSIFGMWLVMKHVSKIVDDGTAQMNPPPPPPPTF